MVLGAPRSAWARACAVALAMIVAAAQPGCVPPSILNVDFVVMSDAIGKSSYDLGKFDECNEVASAQYCIMTTSLFTFGVCVPKDCAVENITNPDTGVMDWLITQIPGLIFLDPYDATFTCGAHTHDWTTPSAVTVALCAALGACVLIASAVDYAHRRAHTAAARAARANGILGDARGMPLAAGGDMDRMLAGKSMYGGPHAAGDLDASYYDEFEDDGEGGMHVNGYGRATGPIAIPAASGMGHSPSVNGAAAYHSPTTGSLGLKSPMAHSLGVATGMGGAAPLSGSLGALPGSFIAGSLSGTALVSGLTLRARSTRPMVPSPLGMELTPAGAPALNRASSGNSAVAAVAVMRRSAGPSIAGGDAAAPLAAPESFRGSYAVRDRRRSSDPMETARAYVSQYDPLSSSLPAALLKCFSLIYNVPRLSAMKGDRSGLFASINGFRSLSMGLIVLGSTISYMAGVGFVNEDAVLPPSGVLTTWTGQVFTSAEFAVDTFLVLSGFLAAHALLKHVATEGAGMFTLRDTAFFLLHRLLRILPVYGLVVLLNMYLVPMLSSGPFWFMTDVLSSNCASNWWTNLLFVNNFVPWSNNTASQCMGWTFYLAVDMQLYLITPVFVALYLIYPSFAAGTLAMLICASISAAGYVAATSNLTVILGDDVQLDVDYSNMYYTKPWMRCPPHFMGVLLAFMWDRVSRKRKELEAAHAPPQNNIGVETFVAMHSTSRYVDPYKWSATQQASVQTVAIGLLATVFYGSLSAYQSPNTWTRTTHVAYTILTRPAWAAGVCMLLFVCFTQPRNILNRIMGAPVWEPISRLTFGAYLVHPIVMQVFFFSTTTYFRYTIYNLASAFVTSMIVSYSVAVLLYLTVEKPCSNMEVVLVHAWVEWWQRRTRASVKASSETSEGSFTPKAASTRPVIVTREDRTPLLTA